MRIQKTVHQAPLIGQMGCFVGILRNIIHLQMYVGICTVLTGEAGTIGQFNKLVLSGLVGMINSSILQQDVCLLHDVFVA